MSGDNKGKRLGLGLGLLGVFAVIFVLIFMPIFGGINGLDYLDNLYNSISKQSAYYIPGLQKSSAGLAGKEVELTLTFAKPGEAQRAALLLTKAGARAQATDASVAFKGDLGAVLSATLADSDAMFHNQGEKLTKRYAANPKLMLYSWWQTLNAMEKSLNRGKLFAAAKQVATVQARAVEMSYNYYGITPESIGSKWMIVVFSLLFYVVYTLWYGYGVMYLFEGAGYRLSH